MRRHHFNRCYDASLRTTTRIEDDVLEELKALARKENAPLTRVLNRTLRVGLEVSRAPRRRRHHSEETHAMGQPRMDLRKALAQTAAMEDEETLRKLALRK